MNRLKEINFKNRTHYFFDDMINMKNSGPKKMKIDKKFCNNAFTY